MLEIFFPSLVACLFLVLMMNQDSQDCRDYVSDHLGSASLEVRKSYWLIAGNALRILEDSESSYPSLLRLEHFESGNVDSSCLSVGRRADGIQEVCVREFPAPSLAITIGEQGGRLVTWENSSFESCPVSPIPTTSPKVYCSSHTRRVAKMTVQKLKGVGNTPVPNVESPQSPPLAEQGVFDSDNLIAVSSSNSSPYRMEDEGC